MLLTLPHPLCAHKRILWVKNRGPKRKPIYLSPHSCGQLSLSKNSSEVMACSRWGLGSGDLLPKEHTHTHTHSSALFLLPSSAPFSASVWMFGPQPPQELHDHLTWLESHLEFLFYSQYSSERDHLAEHRMFLLFFFPTRSTSKEGLVFRASVSLASLPVKWGWSEQRLTASSWSY